MNSRPQFDVLDLRHFAASALRALLADEAARWQARLHWDYRESTDLLLEYLDSRSLTGYAAVQGRRVLGYTFSVVEASKAIIGDLYAFGESEATSNPVCEVLLTHLLETLEAMPGVDRLEAQLLMFPAGALDGPFRRRGFRAIPRLFMLTEVPPLSARPDSPACPPGFALRSWETAAYEEAAQLIHRAYEGHVDAGVNDQYRSVAGAARFLHNIIRFPGCGAFDATHSSTLRDGRNGSLAALLLCSRVRHDMGHITQLCVAPEYRGRGLGSFLLKTCSQALSRISVRGLSLTVTEENRDAVNLYTSAGFRPHHRFEAWVWTRG